MRRVTTLAVIGGGTLAVVTAAAVARSRIQGRETPPSSEEDLQFTQWAPGGPQGFFFNGPIGWAFGKLQPIGHAGVYEVVAEMLDLQPEDELLDIGCGSGAFLASKAPHVRRVVGLDPSRTMLREAERRLADRLSGGTARLVPASSAVLPFDDGEFSAVTAITAPANMAEVFRVLRPGGRFVFVDELIPDPRKPSSERTAGPPWNWTEADTQRVLEDVGFVDVAVRYKPVLFLADNRIAVCRRPAAAPPSRSIDVGDQQELTASAASA